MHSRKLRPESSLANAHLSRCYAPRVLLRGLASTALMAFGCSQITVAAEPPPGTTKLDSVSVTGTRLRPPSELPQSIGPSYGPTRGSSGGPSSGGGGIGGAQPQNAKSVDNSAVNDTEICPTDNPVIIGTGEKLLPQADAESAGLYGMSLRRTYRSKNGSGSMFGTNWPSTFDPSRAVKSPLACIVTEVGCIPRDVSVTFPSGAKYIYTWMPTSPGEYQEVAAEIWARR